MVLPGKHEKGPQQHPRAAAEALRSRGVWGWGTWGPRAKQRELSPGGSFAQRKTGSVAGAMPREQGWGLPGEQSSFYGGVLGQTCIYRPCGTERGHRAPVATKAVRCSTPPRALRSSFIPSAPRS